MTGTAGTPSGTAVVTDLSTARRWRRTRDGTSAATSPVAAVEAVEGEGIDVDWRTWGNRLDADESAATGTLVPGQRAVALAVAAAFLVLAGARPLAAATLFVSVGTVLYAAVLAYRLSLLRAGGEDPLLVRVGDDEARGIRAWHLPTYTVLVPVFREPAVLAGLVEALAAIRYPAHLLDVVLLVEHDDADTVAAALDATSGTSIRVLVVPPQGPRTKPKALNYGLARTTGELVTVYDAEDRPDPLQLRKAAAAFARGADELACLQSVLAYHNPDQNLLTKWFTIEYELWFRSFLPGLAARGAPLPLGGTSNHFKRPHLEAVGAWDPANVTEDADLGIRLHRRGLTVGVLDSTTWEEANSDVVNWVKQRSRWYKGYLQTWLVHHRHPRRLGRELGWRACAGLHLFVGGTPVLALLNPMFWALTIVWFTLRPSWIEQAFLPGVFYLALVTWIVGNAVFVYANLVVCRTSGRCELAWSALVSPVYWVLMSLAAIKAALQLVLAPSYWEKTTHGLSPEANAPEATARAAS